MAKKTTVATIAAGAVDEQTAIQRPRLSKLTVRNFRAIGTKPVTLELDDIVVLVGPNNSGKSSILRAYEVVMQHGAKEGELPQFATGQEQYGEVPVRRFLALSVLGGEVSVRS